MAKNKKYYMVGVIAFAALMLTTLTANAQRDTRSWDDSHLFGLSFGTAQWLDDQDVSFNAALSYDWKIANSSLWLFSQYRAAKADLEEDFSQVLVGVDLGLGWRKSFGVFYIHPRVFGGFGMVAQNYSVSSSAHCGIIESFPFLSFEVGARLDLGVQLGRLCLGVYAEGITQFAPEMSYRHSPYVTVDKKWRTYDPFEVGVCASYSINNGKKYTGGSNVPLVEAYGAIGSYGPEFGGKIIFSENTGFPWKFNQEPGLRYEMCASQQVIFRVSETFGEMQRTCAQVGYGLLVHPWGPQGLVMGRMAVYCGIGERQHSSEVSYVQVYQHDYENQSWGLLTGARGDVEAELIFHYGRFYATVFGGVSYTHVNGTSTDGHVQVDAQEFESPWGWKTGLGIGIAL